MTSSFQISWILKALLWTFSRTRLDGYNSATFLVRMQENLDQKNSEYGHFSRSESTATTIKCKKLCGDKYLIPFRHILRYCKNLRVLSRWRFLTQKNWLNTIIENNNNNSTFQHNIACKKAQVGRNFRYFSEHNIFKTKMNKATWVFTGWSNKLVTYLEKCQPFMMENFGKNL